jgi:hypothetical protein
VIHKASLWGQLGDGLHSGRDVAARASSSDISLTPRPACCLSCLSQVVAYDFGIKTNILRRLASFGCRITVVPATYPASEVLKMNPDGVFFSNGPVSHDGIAVNEGAVVGGRGREVVWTGGCGGVQPEAGVAAGHSCAGRSRLTRGGEDGAGTVGSRGHRSREQGRVAEKGTAGGRRHVSVCTK